MVDNEAEGVRHPGLIAQRPEAHYEESHDLQQRCGVVHEGGPVGGEARNGGRRSASSSTTGVQVRHPLGLDTEGEHGLILSVQRTEDRLAGNETEVSISRTRIRSPLPPTPRAENRS